MGSLLGVALFGCSSILATFFFAQTHLHGLIFTPLMNTGGYSVDKMQSERILQVDGHEVSINFADNPNPAVINQVKQILLASFIANTSKPQSSGILAI